LKRRSIHNDEQWLAGPIGIAVGIDVQSIREVESSLAVFGSRYTRRVFTDDEIDGCSDDLATAAKYFATRFAAKEAVLKVLDPQETIPTWKSIEVRQGAGGRLEIALLDGSTELARRRGIEDFSLSVSDGTGVAIAAVVARIRHERNVEKRHYRGRSVT
jgi:holo-[acyl-carrier protein] synthase